MADKALEFIQMYSVKGVTPFSYDLGVGRVYTQHFKKFGLYGDKNQLFYNKDEMGQAYFEKSEMERSAQSGLVFFSDPKNVKFYSENIEKLMVRIDGFLKRFNEINLETANFATLVDLAKQRNALEEEAFTYYDISEPQVTNKIEEKINFYLMKKVSGQKYSDYSAALTLSSKATTLSNEELEWLELVKEAKNHEIKIFSSDLAKDYPEIYKKLLEHFKKYQQLTIGDGSWTASINYFYKKYDQDSKRSIEDIDKRVDEIKSYPNKVEDEKRRIIKEVGIDPKIAELCETMAGIGHTRLLLRVDGWTPVVAVFYLLDEQFMLRTGISYNELQSKNKEEYEEYITQASTKFADVFPKEGVDKPSTAYTRNYLYWIDNGQVHIFYDDEADKKFSKLVPQDDLSGQKEVKGNIAMTGKAQGKVCIYNWGDDLDERLKMMDENKILMAGMTRPQLMPLIYKAAAIVTDQGGVTSHAAIVSRELKIPCVIGTKVATKVFKDGDMVEVDADSGVVRKVE